MLWLLPVAAGAAWVYKLSKKTAPAGVPGNRIRMRDGSTVRRPPGLSDAAWAAIAEGQGSIRGLLPAPIGSVSSEDGHEDWFVARTKSGWPNEMNRFGGGNDVIDPSIIVGLNERERELWVMNDEGLYNDWRAWKRRQRSRGASTATRKYLRENREEIDAAINRALGRGFGAWAADTDDQADTDSAFGKAVQHMSASELRAHRDNLIRQYRAVLGRRTKLTRRWRMNVKDWKAGHRGAKARLNFTRQIGRRNEKHLGLLWVRIAQIQKILRNTSHPFVPPRQTRSAAAFLGAW